MFLEPSTSMQKDKFVEFPDEVCFFGSDYSDVDPTYVPDSADSSSSKEINKAGARHNIIIPESPNIGNKRLNHNNLPNEVITAVLENLLDRVWASVKPLRRRKQAQRQEWKRNIAKRRKSAGLPYKTNGITRPAKIPKTVNCDKCVFKCTEKFTFEDQNNLCRHYYSLDYIARKNFIISCVQVQAVKTRRLQRMSNKKERSFSKKCFFQKDSDKIQVCQKFFMATLCICVDVISDALNKMDSLGIYTGDDQRGKKVPPNKIKEDEIEFVKQHIESFPVVESHYCRKDSKKKYLSQDVKSILNMYRLYKELCRETGKNPVSEAKYREIFNKEYNLSFFKPKKDLCLLCTNYAKAESKEELEYEYQEHLQRKTVCQAEKDADKVRSNNDDAFMSVTMDLQAVLQIPSGGESILYYMRKFVVYNFTIYEARLPNNAYCLCWSEINGKKGSSEIGTGLLYYLQNEIPKTVTEVSLFSDTCSGQNRNQYISALLLWAVQKIDQLQIIEQKFLESGHTHMEVDSMHAAIENAAKKTSINSVHDWKNVFKQARNKRIKTFKDDQGNNQKFEVDNYKIKEFKYDEMLDLKKLSATIMRNKNKDDMNQAVNWLKIKRIRYVKSDLKIYFNYDMSQNFRSIDVSNRSYTTPKTRATRRSNPPSAAVQLPDDLESLYFSQLPISADKKKDLVTMCNKKIIPEEFHHWIKNMKTFNSNVSSSTDDDV